MLSILQTGRKSWLVMVGFIITFLLAMTMFQKPGFAQGDLIHGRAVYGANCAMCHGESGKGDGSRAADSQSKPTDFTDPKAMEAVTPEKFERSVVEGLLNVAEHTFGHLLTHEEVGDVTRYVRSLIR